MPRSEFPEFKPPSKSPKMEKAEKAQSIPHHSRLIESHPFYIVRKMFLVRF